jgi:hypothetical protein
MEWVFYGVCALILVAMGVAFYHWFLSRPKKLEIPRSLIEQMNSFAEQLGQVAENMKELSDQFKDNSVKEWQLQNRRILRSLKQVNRVLQEMNRIFEKQKSKRERLGSLRPKGGASAVAAEPENAAEGSSEDVADAEENPPLSNAPAITEEEIRSTNWEELIRKLHD